MGMLGFSHSESVICSECLFSCITTAVLGLSPSQHHRVGTKMRHDHPKWVITHPWTIAVDDEQWLIIHSSCDHPVLPADVQSACASSAAPVYICDVEASLSWVFASHYSELAHEHIPHGVNCRVDCFLLYQNRLLLVQATQDKPAQFWHLCHTQPGTTTCFCKINKDRRDTNTTNKQSYNILQLLGLYMQARPTNRFQTLPRSSVLDDHALSPRKPRWWNVAGAMSLSREKARDIPEARRFPTAWTEPLSAQ